ncbi:MAG: hypothetical protein MJY62_03660, partial [Bacteroidales bacterium]|nr:hypothetical protein [Bacteroidales bacterium]
MKEKIIVTLTTWKPRMKNIPTVLDSIFAQSVPPDLVVLNLADDEILPEELREYLSSHKVEVNRMPNLKVYKKLVPTLRKYPRSCVISIDDDWIYPPGMIEDFMNVHSKYPDSPVSGNKVTLYGRSCHCGCASLTKAEYFGQWLDCIDERVMKCCACDDLAYTYFIARAGRSYVRTEGTYYENMKGIEDECSYSEAMPSELDDSWEYLQERFGHIGEPEVLIHLHVNHPCCVPGYLRRLENVRGCRKSLVVTYSKADDEISEIALRFPGARLLQVEPSEDGMDAFVSLLKEKGVSYDYALHATTWNGRKIPFFNSLNLSGFELSRTMLGAILASPERFRRALSHIGENSRRDIVCGIEGYRISEALRGKSFAECCPVSIFLCRADASLFEGV